MSTTQKSKENLHIRFEVNPELVSERKRHVPDLKAVPDKQIISAECPNKQLVRMQVRKMELERNRFLNQMRRGAILYKFNQRTGSPEKRWFLVDPDGSNLSWTKPETNVFGIKTTKKKNLADALYLTYGKAEGVKGDNVPPWLCFSVVFCEKLGKSWITKEINLGCNTQKQFETWFFGIQSLIPLHHQHKSQAVILWERAIMKVEKIAEKQALKPAKVWQALFESAIRHVKGSNYKSLLRKLVHMNLARLAREAREKGILPGSHGGAGSLLRRNSMNSITNSPRSAPGIDRKRRSRREIYLDSPRRSPRSGNRKLMGLHDLTEKMIHRKTPYIEKKVLSRSNSERKMLSRTGSGFVKES